MLTFPPHLAALQTALSRSAPLVRLPSVSTDYLKALLRAVCEQGALVAVDVFEDGYGLSRLTATGALAPRAAPEKSVADYLTRAAREFDPDALAAQGRSCLWLPLAAEQLGSTDVRAALGVWCRRHAGVPSRFVLVATDAALSSDLQEWVKPVEFVSPRRDEVGLSYLESLLCHYHRPLQKQDARQQRRVSERLLTRVQGLDAWSMAAVVSEAQATLAGGSPLHDLTAWEEGMMRALKDAKAGRLHRAVGLELQTLDGFSSDQLVGMERYKRHLDYMSALFHNPEDCAKNKISLPKGVLLVGLPGCGKSLAAKLTASRLSLPLLRLDVGSLMGGLLGDSEQNLRRATEVASSAAPCVLWIDELDKALSGLGGNEAGGTGPRLLGALLTWMQEQQGVYVFATANRVKELPVELLRRGRFDELWKVLLPTVAERRAMLQQKLRERGVEWQEAELAEAVKQTEGFAGADLEALVREAQVCVFCTMAPRLSGAVFAEARAQFTPLSKQFEPEIKEEIARLELHGFRDVSGAEGLPPEVALSRRALGSSDLVRLVSLDRPLRFHFGDNEGVGFTLEIGLSGKGEVCGRWVDKGEPMPEDSQPFQLRAKGAGLDFKDGLSFRGDLFKQVVSEGGRLLVCANSGIRVREESRFEGSAGAASGQNGSCRRLRVGGVEFELVYCPPGEFWMGSMPGEGDVDERPRHRVRVARGFWIGKTPVTQALWQEVMGTNPSQFKLRERPVEQVSWYEALEFCNKLSGKVHVAPAYRFDQSNGIRLAEHVYGVRLLTEIEWEYAAKAGTDLTFAGSESPEEVGWLISNYRSSTRAVASKNPNAWGLYDMSGNVEEWCEAEARPRFPYTCLHRRIPGESGVGGIHAELQVKGPKSGCSCA